MCVPCRNEARSIGPLVADARRHLMDAAPVLDELIVIDDRSTDCSASVASAAGATVVAIDSVHALHGT
jgi:glucosyl-3-phosphoglycerate synthase